MSSRLVLSARLAVGSLGLLLLMPAALCAQSISHWDGESSIAALPQPVRETPAQVVTHPVAHPRQMPTEFHTRSLVDPRSVPNQLNLAMQPHRVLVSPDRQIPTDPAAAPRNKPLTLDHLKHRRPIQPPAAVLPQSNRQQTWKSPYSYGHFGASGTRHWSVHHGYRDRVSEWRLR